jgi:hypothetical protein
MSGEKTFWNGEPCKARVVIAIVGASLRPTWWCAALQGQRREVVEVQYGDQTFYLDNDAWEEDGDLGGSGWRKVTIGKGSPQWGHRNVPVERVIQAAKRG